MTQKYSIAARLIKFGTQQNLGRLLQTYSKINLYIQTNGLHPNIDLLLFPECRSSLADFYCVFI